MEKKKRTPLGGILALLMLIGAALYSAYAQSSEPPLEPARTLILLQLLWGGGVYGVKITLLTSFLILLFATLLPFACGAFIVNRLRRSGARAEGVSTLPSGASLTWTGSSGPVVFASGVAVLAFCLGFHWLALTDPRKLAFVGSFGGFALFFSVFGILPGAFLILDVVLPKEWVVGRVDNLEPQATNTAPHSKIDVRVDDRKLSMDSELASKLRSGEKIAVKVSQILDRVVEVRR